MVEKRRIGPYPQPVPRLCHQFWMADLSAARETAPGAKSHQASRCLSETDVNTGLFAAIAASNTAARPRCVASTLPNLLRTTRSLVETCGSMAAAAASTPAASTKHDVSLCAVSRKIG